MEKQRIIHRDATLWPPTPTRAPNSVFDTAPKPRGERTPMPALTVRYDVPLPAVKPLVPTRRYDETLQAMRVGASLLDLTENQAKTLQRRARSLGIALERRKIDARHYGVWRVDKIVSKTDPLTKGFARKRIK